MNGLLRLGRRVYVNPHRVDAMERLKFGAGVRVHMGGTELLIEDCTYDDALWDWNKALESS